MNYPAASPLKVTESTTIQARVVTQGNWSPLVEGNLVIAVPATADSLRVSEVNYHPGAASDDEAAAGFAADDFEFIELTNISDQVIDLINVSLAQVMSENGLQGVTFHFDDGAITTLAPGRFVVVVENRDAFAQRYGANIAVAGEWSGSLSNSSEIITVQGGETLLQQFTYDDSWLRATDGDGATLEIIDPRGADLGAWSTSDAWQSSLNAGGTPGYAGGWLPGDANHDGAFNSDDLVLVLQAGEFEDGVDGNSTWERGDWDLDGDFTTKDLVVAFTRNTYESTGAAASAAQDAALAAWPSTSTDSPSLDSLAASITRTKKSGALIA